jgi:hypothetical protein
VQPHQKSAALLLEESSTGACTQAKLWPETSKVRTADGGKHVGWVEKQLPCSLDLTGVRHEARVQVS